MTGLSEPPNEPCRLSPLTQMPRSFASGGEQRTWLRQIFDQTAPDYDRVERWLSLGSGRWYRRQALLRAGLTTGMVVADVATGTGLVAREALRIVGPAGRVVGIDPSEGMLARAAASLRIETTVAWADALPFPDGTFDFLSMGYALRHLEDLDAAFREFARVLKPGGRVCILEISRPRNAVGRGLLGGYLGLIAGAGCRVAHVTPRTSELWRYYRQTIEECIPAERIVKSLQDSGFPDAGRTTQLGMFNEFVGKVREGALATPL